MVKRFAGLTLIALFSLGSNVHAVCGQNDKMVASLCYQDVPTGPFKLNSCSRYDIWEAEDVLDLAKAKVVSDNELKATQALLIKNIEKAIADCKGNGKSEGENFLNNLLGN